MTRGRNQLLLFAKGMAMGAADVVPGVSGGTIAFISGIYEELVDSLKSLNPAALKILARGGPARFWSAINGSFLLVLFAGVFTSLFSLANVVHFLLAEQPLLVWSFFLGLIIASIIYIMRQFRLYRPVCLLFLLAGVGGGLLASFAPAHAMAVGPVTIFFSGMLAVCAMILPGVSGSFILLLIGMYPVMIEAITRLQWSFLATFAAGAAIGLVLFSNLLSWLLHHFREVTLSVLTGFLVGSVPVVWPWKMESVAEQASRELLTPAGYSRLVGDPRLPECLLLMVTGLVVVLGLEYLGGRLAHRKRGL